MTGQGGHGLDVRELRAAYRARLRRRQEQPFSKIPFAPGMGPAKNCSYPGMGPAIGRV